MDSEKIIFIILAILFSIVSLFVKSKKQKQTRIEEEVPDTDFSYESDSFPVLNPEDFFKLSAVQSLHENANIVPKRDKKKPKQQNFEKKNFLPDNSKIISQDFDLESENELLAGFEGSELQKAFLYSEIFKNTKN